MISDRDPRFVSKVYKEVAKALGIKLSFSTASHPQTDGQSERSVQSVTTLLRCLVADNLRPWPDLLPLVEFCINSSPHAVTKVPPFQATQGFTPSLFPVDVDFLSPVAEDLIDSINATVQRCRDMLQYQNAVTTSSQTATATPFAEGEDVYVSSELLLDDQHRNKKRKLRPRFLGPVKIKRVLGPAHVTLQLPPGVHIHPTVNIKHLKKPTRLPRDVSRPPPLHGSDVYELESIQGHRTTRRGTQYLCKWKGYPSTENTYEHPDNLLGKDARLLLANYKQQFTQGESVVIDRRLDRARGSRQGVRYVQQGLFACSALAVAGLVTGYLYETQFACPKSLPAGVSNGTPPARIPDPFTPLHNIRLIHTDSHVFTCVLSVPVIGVALLLSSVLTPWRNRLHNAIKRLEHRKEEQEGVSSPANSFGGDNVNVQLPTKQDDSRSLATDGASPSGDSTETNRARSKLRWLVSGLLWFVRTLLWVGYERPDPRRASRSQWFCYFVGAGAACFSLVLYVYTHDGEVAARYAQAVASPFLLLAFVNVLHSIQLHVDTRYKYGSEKQVQAVMATVTAVGGATLLAQFFLWAFFVAFAYATLPCLPLREGGTSRPDVAYLSKRLFLRYIGCFIMSCELLFAYMWWILEFAAGGASVVRMVQFRGGALAIVVNVLVVVATFVGVSTYAGVFSSQESIFFVKQPAQYVTPKITLTLAYIFFGLWFLCFSLMGLKDVSARVQKYFVQNEQNETICMLYRSEDGELATYIAKEIKNKSPRFLGQANSVEVVQHNVDHEAYPACATPSTDSDEPSDGDLQRADQLNNTRVLVVVISCHNEPPFGSVGRMLNDNDDAEARANSNDGDVNMFLLQLIIAYEMEKRDDITIYPIFDARDGSTRIAFKSPENDLPDTTPEPTAQAAANILKRLYGKEGAKFDVTVVELLREWSPRNLMHRMLQLQGTFMHNLGEVTAANTAAAGVLKAYEESAI
ncbi:hypothetical protein PTSG_13156 [Salpingoeca rosetta]|uniref:Integrase catalytic domain-containing protein n=1 Tax=Salpingoeca rosetta (strain ATCC 50818 / BSB-021) TaxID=946362 RepID=F2USS4_SALR5|nr:uncharacterized protein PTSG_13156 [Salpingoeca rosetta]EGD81183.1 hypothetical protein PTSG_13156 [Salpingoeca rosetta]|eukprot:XP_004987718.1 hypothetical protein PTSG_13156 [Salpingoeca rosetta]